MIAAVRARAFARAFRAAVAPGSEPAGVGRNLPAAGSLKHRHKIGKIDQVGKVGQVGKGGKVGLSTSDLNLDAAIKTLIKDIEIAHVLQQPRAGRTP